MYRIHVDSGSSPGAAATLVADRADRYGAPTLGEIFRQVVATYED